MAKKRPAASRSIVLATIGYEGRTRDDFLNLLRNAGIETIVDVSYRPRGGSTAFDRSELFDSLAENGIKYFQPPAIVAAADLEGSNSGGQPDVAAYERYALARIDATTELAMQVIASRCCFLCRERMAFGCHRAALAGELTTFIDEDVTIRHL